MSVSNALMQRANAPLVEHVTELLREKGLSLNSFGVLVYGSKRLKSGKAGSASQVYKIMSGTNRPTDMLLQRWAPVLGVSVESLQALRAPEEPRRVGRPAAAKPSNKANGVIAQRLPMSTPVKREAPPAAAGDGPPQFSLIVDARGRATLTVNLVDLPVAKAMQAIAALTGAGLLAD